MTCEMCPGRVLQLGCLQHLGGGGSGAAKGGGLRWPCKAVGVGGKAQPQPQIALLLPPKTTCAP